jgi:hypothetical protein
MRIDSRALATNCPLRNVWKLLASVGCRANSLPGTQGFMSVAPLGGAGTDSALQNTASTACTPSVLDANV